VDPVTVAVYTLGCKLNAYESEWYLEQFGGRGYRVVAFGEPADVTVVNTCTVTSSSDAQSRQALRRARRASPQGRVVAVGCTAQTDAERLQAMPEVDLVVGTADKTRLVDLLDGPLAHGEAGAGEAEPQAYQSMGIHAFGNRSRAFVKVQDGCDAFCSYCAVPFARGRSRSRPLADAVAEVERLVCAGFQEVVLTGVDIGSYGRDLRRTDLTDLFGAVESVEGLCRYRVSSIEAPALSPELVEYLAASRRFCRHLHIPLQSGDDSTLLAMRRPYTRDRYANVLRLLSDRIEGISIGADVMVGFPGESEEAFRRTCDLVENTPISYLHVFQYSPRRNTGASRLPDSVDPATKKARSATLRDIGRRKRESFSRGFVGKELEVLFERRREGDSGCLRGVSDNYIRVYTRAPETAADRIRRVRVLKVDHGRVLGELCLPEGRGADRMQPAAVR